MVFRGHGLCRCPGFETLRFGALAGVSGIWFNRLQFQKLLEKNVNPEAQFLGSQQVFNHPAQTAGSASGSINRRASAFGTFSSSAAWLLKSARDGAGHQNRTSATEVQLQEQLLSRCFKSDRGSGLLRRGLRSPPHLPPGRGAGRVLDCRQGCQRQNTHAVGSISAALI